MHPIPPHPALTTFQWNTLITSLFRSGDVAAARRCFDTMPAKNAVTYNCMVSGYVLNRNLPLARAFFDSTPLKTPISFSTMLHAYAKAGHLHHARALFDLIQDKNVVCWNAMMSCYVRFGMVDAARELFNGMPERSDVSWGVMVSGYVRVGRIDKARRLFEEAPCLGRSVCNNLMSGYLGLGRWREALEVFEGIQERDVVSWNVAVSCYVKAGRMECARKLFDEMPVRDVVSWTTMIRGYLVSGEIEAAREFFDESETRDVITWNTMIGGYVQRGMLEEALRLFDEMPTPDVVSYNSILHGYVQNEDMGSAIIWFEAMPEKDKTSWNTLISGYRDKESLVQLCRMMAEGFRPDQATFTVVISTISSLPAIEWGRMMHACAVKIGYDLDTLVSSSLITMYSKCGLIAESSFVFSQMPKRDTIAWNAMIAARAYHGFSTESFILFEEMTLAGFQPDHVTFLALLSACAHGGLVDEGLNYFKSMNKWKLVPKPEHYACIVDLLGRSGSVQGAYEFIKRVPENLQFNTWETLLSACRFGGNLEIAEVAAKKILDAQPTNGGMYVVLSNIYAAKGRWEDASRIRGLMRRVGAKKEAASSWIEVKGCVHFFGCDDMPHTEAEDVYKILDNLSIIMEGTD